MPVQSASHGLFSNHNDVEYCPRCDGRTQRDIVTQLYYDQTNQEYFQLVSCHQCEKIFLFIYQVQGNLNPTGMTTIARTGNKPRLSLKKIIPSVDFKKANSYAPKNVQKFYEEAMACLIANAPNGAVAMLRRTLQEICIDLGADPDKDLYEQINKKINPIVLPEAAETRFWGNLGTHPDKKQIISDVSIKDAKTTVEFLDRIIYQHYEYPSKIGDSKDKREGKN